MSQDVQQTTTSNNNDDNKGFADSGDLSGIAMFHRQSYLALPLHCNIGLYTIVMTFYHACSAR